MWHDILAEKPQTADEWQGISILVSGEANCEARTYSCILPVKKSTPFHINDIIASKNRNCMMLIILVVDVQSSFIEAEL